MNFIEVSREQLLELHHALSLFEKLNSDIIGELDLYLYAITTSPTILDAAKEAIADYMNDTATEEAVAVSEQDVELSEVAVAIPCSSDALYYLLGTGLKVQQEEFVYNSGDSGEGVRQMSFVHATFKPRMAITDFTEIALAQSSSWADEFLKRFGQHDPALVEKKQVNRTEEATQPAEPMSGTVRGSREGGKKLKKWVEDFLG